MPREDTPMTPALLIVMPGGRLPAVNATVLAPVPPVVAKATEYGTPILAAATLAVVIDTGGLMVMLKVLVIVAPEAS